MTRLFFTLLILLVIPVLMLAQDTCWFPTADFPTPEALTIYCLAKDYYWGNITVGGVATTSNYPMFTSTNNGNSWMNIGPTPTGTVYAVAQDQSTLGTKYAIIRDGNTSNNGLFRRTNTFGWQLRACGGLDVRGVVQRYGTVLCGVRGASNGIYRSTNDGDSFSQIYSSADIYCFEAVNNTMWAGGYDTRGVLLKSTSFPFNSWTRVASFEGIVIGLTVSSTGNIFVATHQGKIYRSISGGDFEICRTGVSWNELAIPIVTTSQGYVFYGDYQTGVYYSTDNGTNWIQCNTGLPSNRVVAIAVNPNNNDVYLGLGYSLSSRIYRFNWSVISAVDLISSTLPSGFSLSQNFPNPFNSSTNIQFDLAVTSPVKLQVLDILGREVVTLVNDVLKPGSYQVHFDASRFSSGIYIYQLQTARLLKRKKMILNK